MSLHIMPPSANSVSVMLLNSEAKLGLKENNCYGQTRSEEFVKKNPFHCAPMLEDGDFLLWESGAILKYLANANKLDQWYPTDPKQRAKVDQIMDCRQTAFYPLVGKICYPAFGWGSDFDAVEPAKKDLTDMLVKFAKAYLADGKFAGGFDKPTIADLHVVTSFEFLRGVKYEFSKEIEDYANRVEAALPTYKQTCAALLGMRDSFRDKK